MKKKKIKLHKINLVKNNAQKNDMIGGKKKKKNWLTCWTK